MKKKVTNDEVSEDNRGMRDWNPDKRYSLLHGAENLMECVLQPRGE